MSIPRSMARWLPLALLAAAPLLSAAQSAGSTQRVEISSAQAADAPRRDVASVCPNIADELPEILASAWQQVGQPGTVREQMLMTLSDGCGNAIEFKGLTDIANVYAVKQNETAMA